MGDMQVIHALKNATLYGFQGFQSLAKACFFVEGIVALYGLELRLDLANGSFQLDIPSSTIYGISLPHGRRSRESSVMRPECAINSPRQSAKKLHRSICR
jgi:hypothetical protein